MSFDPQIPLPQPVQVQYADPRAAVLAFRRDLFTATPRVFVTHIIVAINVAIFLLMSLTAGGFFSPSIATMIRWGAGFGPYTTNGQPWRLFTEMFLHFGVIHVGMNMFVLWQGGPLVERLFGNFAYFVIYIFSGLCGSFLSLYFHPYSVAAGASGAVFGVYGALLGFLCVQRGMVPPAILKSLFNAAGMFVVYNVIFGFMVRGIDMYAHGGGLVGGFLLGMLLSRRLAPRANLVRTIVVAAVGTLLAFYGATHLRPIPLPNDADDSLAPRIHHFS
jgi:rhomboid protease GluP